MTQIRFSIIIFLLLIIKGASSQPIEYELVDISALTGLGSKLQLTCINNAGVMAGSKDISGGRRPLIMTIDEDDNYTTTNLPVPADTTYVEVHDIAEDGTVVGAAYLPTGPGGQTEITACYWKNGQFHEIGFLSSSPIIIGENEYPQLSRAFAISPDGSQIVGTSRMNDAEGEYISEAPFVFDASTGTLTHIPTPDGFPVSLRTAGAVNDSGDIAFQAAAPPSADRYLVLYRGGVFSQPLQSLPESDPDTWGLSTINNHGDVASTVFIDSDPDIIYATHLTTSTGTVQLPRLSDGSGGFDQRGEQNGILDSRVIYGSSGDYEAGKFACLWYDGEIHAIDDLATAGSNSLRQFSEVLGMNESGHGVVTSWATRSVSATRYAYYMRPRLDPDSFEGWFDQRYGYPFPEPERLAEDGDQNGQPLLLDYALGDAWEPFFSLAEGETSLTLQRTAAHEGVILRVKMSPDLEEWDVVATFSGGAWTRDQGTLLDFTTTVSGETEHFTLSLPDGLSPVFFRIEAALP